MAKKKDKALKSLEKDVAKLRKRNDKLAEAIEKTQEDQAAAYKELRSLLEERLPAQDAGSCRAGRRLARRRRGTRGHRSGCAAGRELDIDLSSAKGTGARGRILVKDIEAAASRD